MEKELYQVVAYIALRNKDGSPMINVPLYVKVSEMNKNGMTEAQESVMHRIAEIMIKRNEKQLSDYFASANKTAIGAGGLPPACGV
ncbi:MAG: hypothetical protein K2N23_07975 [Clostridia bacterium]|nr:hypothetical protein [Clostridia bacterium]